MKHILGSYNYPIYLNERFLFTQYSQSDCNIMIGRKYGDPFARLEENIKKNPLGGDRQRRDLQELHKYNRVSRLTSCMSLQKTKSSSQNIILIIFSMFRVLLLESKIE